MFYALNSLGVYSSCSNPIGIDAHSHVNFATLSDAAICGSPSGDYKLNLSWTCN